MRGKKVSGIWEILPFMLLPISTKTPEVGQKKEDKLRLLKWDGGSIKKINFEVGHWISSLTVVYNFFLKWKGKLKDGH